MTNDQLKIILDWIPTFLLSLGVLLTTLVGLYIQIRTKIEVREIKEQAKDIIKQTDGVNTALQESNKATQAKLDVAIEKGVGLERLLASKDEGAKSAVPAPLAAQIQAPPDGSATEPFPVVVSDIDAAAALKLAELAKAGKPPKPVK